VVLDIDPRHNGDDTLLDLELQYEKIPNTLEALTGGGGRHIIFKYPGRKIPNDSRGLFFGQGIDVRGDGGYIVAAPSMHVSGRAYEWEASCDPASTPILDMPGWVLGKFPNSNGNSNPTPNNGKTATAGASAPGQSSAKKIKPGERNSTLTSLAGAMRRRGMPQAVIETVLLETNKQLCTPPLPDAEVKRIAQSSNKWPAGGRCPTDDELAEEFIDSHPDTLYGLTEFRRYKNGIWAPIDVEKIKSEILEIAVDAKAMGYKPSSFKIRSILDIVRMQIDTEMEQWNSNSNLLVCKNGTLEIDKRIMRDHKKEDYITSGVPYDYISIADDTLWLKYLDDTVPLAAEFLQEFAGYSLTTDCQYEIAVWLYGPRGSGKSTFIEGLKAMLGTKAGQLGLAQLENSRFGLADLPSRTLLFSTEQPSEFIRTGHVLNALISGEEVIMERKFKDAEHVIPHAKLLWAMNDLPRIKEASSGLFRRVKVVEFPKLDETKRDPKIKQAIQAMGPAILNWALDGLDRLNRRGRFEIPDCVKKATMQFEEVNDIFKMYTEERCDLGSSYKERAGTLYADYTTWCIENGHKPKSSTSLAIDDYKRYGLVKVHTMTGNYYEGIRLKP
jgi:putative DNA primase/helicase